MRMLIDNRDLELLLEKKKKFIGNKVTVDTMIAGISFLLSVFTATYSDWFGIPGIVFKTVFCFIGILYCAKIVKDIVEIESPGEIILTDTSGRDPAHGRVDRSGFRQCAFTVRVLGRRAERGILFVVDRFE